MQREELRQALAAVRDSSRPPAERAIAATVLAAGGFADDEPPGQVRPADAASRMFEYCIAHENATRWDERSARTGTISYVDSGRIEQYVGRGTWIVYAAEAFAGTPLVVGDQVRIAGRNGAIEIERIGPNRIGASPSARHASSGLTVMRTTPVGEDELASIAASVAQRYSASLMPHEGGVTIDFSGARCRLVESAPVDSSAEIRVDVDIRTDRPEAALNAERALVLAAALLMLDGVAIAVDDTGATFNAKQLYGLAKDNRLRADAFAFAVAVAQRNDPPESLQLLEGFADELVVFSTQPSNAEATLAALDDALHVFWESAERSGDQTVPPFVAYVPPESRAEAAALQPLVQLAYETVEVAVVFIDAGVASDRASELVTSRNDVAALLDAPIRNATVFASRPRTTDADIAQLTRDACRADVFVTALATALMHGALAGDASGMLYSQDQMIDFALYRRGRAGSNRIQVEQT